MFQVYPNSYTGKYLSTTSPTLKSGFLIGNYNGIQLTIYNNGVGYTSGKTLLQRFKWSHIALVFDPDNKEVNIYVNAKHKNFMSYALLDFHTAKTEALVIGKSYKSELASSIGATIDDLVIWESTLTSGDIKVHISWVL